MKNYAITAGIALAVVLGLAIAKNKVPAFSGALAKIGA